MALNGILPTFPENMLNFTSISSAQKAQFAVQTYYCNKFFHAEFLNIRGFIVESFISRYDGM